MLLRISMNTYLLNVSWLSNKIIKHIKSILDIYPTKINTNEDFSYFKNNNNNNIM